MHCDSIREPFHNEPAHQPSVDAVCVMYGNRSKCVAALSALCCLVLITGCGKTIQNTATEQLILSDSVDRAVRNIDFSALSGQTCYLDTTYLKTTKSPTFVNADYVISSLRNQIVSAGCHLVSSNKDAEIIVEPRIGTLGANEHEVTYGVPSSNLLTQAASLVPTAPPIPPIPEISLARKSDQMAATKMAVFAYDAETGYPVWQSGVSTARSNAKDSWLLGVGPFQSGTIYQKPRFAGVRIKLPLIGSKDADSPHQAVAHDEAFVFAPPPVPVPEPEPVQTADSEPDSGSNSKK